MIRTRNHAGKKRDLLVREATDTRATTASVGGGCSNFWAAVLTRSSSDFATSPALVLDCIKKWFGATSCIRVGLQKLCLVPQQPVEAAMSSESQAIRHYSRSHISVKHDSPVELHSDHLANVPLHTSDCAHGTGVPLLWPLLQCLATDGCSRVFPLLDSSAPACGPRGRSRIPTPGMGAGFPVVALRFPLRSAIGATGVDDARGLGDSATASGFGRTLGAGNGPVSLAVE